MTDLHSIGTIAAISGRTKHSTRLVRVVPAVAAEEMVLQLVVVLHGVVYVRSQQRVAIVFAVIVIAVGRFVALVLVLILITTLILIIRLVLITTPTVTATIVIVLQFAVQKVKKLVLIPRSLRRNPRRPIRRLLRRRPCRKRRRHGRAWRTRKARLTIGTDAGIAIGTRHGLVAVGGDLMT